MSEFTSEFLFKRLLDEYSNITNTLKLGNFTRSRDYQCFWRAMSNSEAREIGKSKPLSVALDYAWITRRGVC